MTRTGRRALLALTFVAIPAAGVAQEPAALILGPPPPVAPAVITRDAAGGATVRAVRVLESPRIDGRLDEAIYRSTEAISGFLQQEPVEGAPATERTELWVLYDDRSVYVTARMWDSQPDKVVATEMRRDNTAIYGGDDSLAFAFDTFYDRQNGATFAANLLGARSDGQITNERQFNADWNPIWEVRTARFENGWIMEAAVPFKSLRYRAGEQQVWGLNVRRTIRSKNEITYLTRIPAARGGAGIQHLSGAATLVGLEAPPPSRLLELKPFVVTSLVAARSSPTRMPWLADTDIGLDARYSLTDSVTADLTINTDFAQVEADEQQINLTRQSLFFPEKRDFFLENLGMFSFGGVSNTGAAAASSDAPILFYSRRIGLGGGQPVPITAGGRVTGRVGRYSLGVINIQQDTSTGLPATNFSVVRVRRDILRRSSVGVMMTGRSASELQPGSNLAYGVDASLAFFSSLNINGYYARTRSTAAHGDDTSYRAQLDYAGDRYGVQLERLLVGRNFIPDIGLLRRPDIRKNLAQFRFSPRPLRSRWLRRLSWIGSVNYIENNAGQLETRTRDGEFALELQAGDRIAVGVTDSYEVLHRPFPLAPGVAVPTGGFTFRVLRAGINVSQQRRLNANVQFERGSFYGGERTTLSIARGRFSLPPRLSFEPTYSLNRVVLPEERFTAHLLGTRITVSPTPQMFVSTLVQFNSINRTLAANARFRWEYRPGSEIFVVFNEQRNTGVSGFPLATNRAVILKITRLFRT